MYLLDTDTLIFNLKGDRAVKKNLERHIDDPLKICMITIMELYFGAHKSERVTANIAKIGTIEAIFEILPVGKGLAEIYGMLKATMEKSGTPLDDFDLAIAACAISHNLVLVTNHLKHFRRIDGLKLTNWTVYPEKKLGVRS